MFKIFKNNLDYDNNIKQYTKKDGICAFILFFIIILEYALLGILNNSFNFIHNNIKIVGCIANIIMIIITILFVKINKQKLNTIGLVGGRWILSTIIGILLGLYYFYCNCGSHLIDGSKLISLNKIPLLVIYFLLVSLCEELVFRGYIGTRINAIIKNKYIGIIVTSLLFVIMHFPYRMIAYNMSIYDLLIVRYGWIINLIIFHIIMNFIYSKTNSLYGSIIPHWLSNLGESLIAK